VTPHAIQDPPAPAAAPDDVLARRAAIAASIDAVVADREFGERLLLATPRAWVVPTLVAANVLAFAFAVFRGNLPLTGIDANDLVAWGADWGPATLGGEPWRLITSTFLHSGLTHLVVNMVALWSVGRVVERLFGNARFAALYFTAGLFGSAVSVLVNPQLASAGASGAVLGVYGALGGFALRQRRAVPRTVFAGFAGLATTFLGLNLVIGFVAPAGIAVAAHVGGAVAGLAAGAFLARPVEPGRSRGIASAALVAAAGLALVPAAAALPFAAERAPLARRALPGFSIELPRGTIVGEEIASEHGILTLKSYVAGRALVQVRWQDEPVPREKLAGLALAAGAKLQVRAGGFVAVPGPAGRGVETFAAESGLGKVSASLVECGNRNVVVLTAGNSRADLVHRRIIGTLTCDAI
jgi:membrane associated rhomboid family serine protease